MKEEKREKTEEKEDVKVGGKKGGRKNMRKVMEIREIQVKEEEKEETEKEEREVNYRKGGKERREKRRDEGRRNRPSILFNISSVDSWSTATRGSLGRDSRGANYSSCRSVAVFLGSLAGQGGAGRGKAGQGGQGRLNLTGERPHLVKVVLESIV
ncbi:hypothetical protein E2C01_048599 [Portunus trituberculatus]|uniref:Uncharacterized protein n=1 Tax=Portunus trituberculatus TaxID=210409 RepID=A0A5B7GBH1_PORTR|nr:hypothetical protein [Portunus trituberculatus]